MKQRLLFWGTSSFAVPIFNDLLQQKEIEVVGVVTQPDQPAGRHQKLVSSPLNRAAQISTIPIFTPTKLSDTSFFETVQALQPDVSLVVAYGRLIPRPLLDLTKHGTLNVHPSLLPLYRGPSPIQAAIMNGNSETGVSLMLLDNEMDHGPIIAQEHLKLSGNERAPELANTLAQLASQMVSTHLIAYVNGERIPQPQDHDRATYCKLLSRDDGRIDWHSPAVDIERRERAFDPWPGIWTEWNDGTETRRMKVFGARIESHADTPGSMQITTDNRLSIGTGSTAISFSEVQVDGKKRMSVADLIRGWPTFLQGHLIVDSIPADQ